MPTRWTEHFVTALLDFRDHRVGFYHQIPRYGRWSDLSTAHAAPVRLVANTSGKMYLLRESGDYLCKGDVIAYIESGADIGISCTWTQHYVQQVLRIPVWTRCPEI